MRKNPVTINLGWGSHYFENKIYDRVNILVEEFESQTISISDPTIENIVHRHLYEPRHLYVVKNCVLNTFTGKAALGNRDLRSTGAPHLISRRRHPRFSWLQPRKQAGLTYVIPSVPYYHWLIEELPLVISVARRLPEVNFVHDPRLPNYARQALKLLGVESEETTRLLNCERAVLSLRDKDTGWPRPDDVQLLRDKILAGGAFQTRDKKGDSKIHIIRGKAQRSPTNENEMVRALNKVGFTTLDLTDLPWIKQVDLFFHADLVVAQHGAGLSNVVFCKPGTRVIELSNPSYSNPCFEILAKWVDLKFERLKIGEDQNSNPLIGVSEVYRTLTLLSN